MSTNGNKIIISDWNKNLKAYRAPNNFFNEFKSSYDFYFTNKNLEENNVVAYFGNTPTEEYLNCFKNLEWVHFGSVGIDKISEDFIKNRNLTVTNSKGINSNSVITYCVGELFRSCKVFNVGNKSFQNRDKYDDFFEHMLDFDDIDLAILGYGKIGRGLKEFLSGKVNSINIVTRTKRKKTGKTNYFSLNELKPALEGRTHIINVLPLTKETFNFINFKSLKFFPKDVFYINAGRGETNDMEEIKKISKKGLIRGCSMDVFGLPNGEIKRELLELDNFTLTPHISGWTKNFWDSQKSLCKKNIKLFQKKDFKNMKNLVFIQGNLIK